MRCAECRYSTKIMGCVPVMCQYDDHNYFLVGWTLEKDHKPGWCPYRLKIVNRSEPDEHDDSEPDTD